MKIVIGNDEVGLHLTSECNHQLKKTSQPTNNGSTFIKKVWKNKQNFLTQLQYPQDLILELHSIFTAYQTNQVLEFFGYIFAQMYMQNKTWVKVPYQTMEAFFPKHYYKILNKLIPYLDIDHDYSYVKHECKSYYFKSSFIKRMSHFNTFTEFVKFIDGITSTKELNLSPEFKAGTLPTENTINNLSNQSINSSPILLLPFLYPSSNDPNKGNNSNYTLDNDGLTNIKTIIYDAEYTSETIKQSAIQSTKNNLKQILMGQSTETISKKNGRHFNNITQLNKEIRKLLIKNTHKYLGEIDLKCCRGFILLNIIKPFITIQAYENVYNLLKDKNLWDNLMTYTNIKTKDKVKSKFQLFLNGTLRDNQCNPIFKYFFDFHPTFTDLLFQLKENNNHLCNDTDQIEASVMHSDDLTNYIQGLNLTYDIIHDCLFIYGESNHHANVLDAASKILLLFKEKYNYQMSLSIEIKNKDKLTFDFSNIDHLDKLKESMKHIESEFVKLQKELKKERLTAFFNKNNKNAFVYYTQLKEKENNFLLQHKPQIDAYLEYLDSINPPIDLEYSSGQLNNTNLPEI